MMFTRIQCLGGFRIQMFLQTLALLCLFTTLTSVMSVTSINEPSYYTLRENCRPHGIHIAFGNTTQDIVIMWSSVANCSSSVKYGDTIQNKKYKAEPTTVFFNLTNSLARHYYYHAVLKDLKPNTTYYYSIVNSKMVTPAYFKTPPKGNEWSPSFVLFGDLGVESRIHPTLTNEALSGKYSAFFHIGDFAYNFEDDGGQNGDEFMDIIQDYAKYVPYMTAPGNHEIDNETFAQYRYRFSMPGTSWPMKMNKLWYSFDIGPVHFISYSTEVFFIKDTRYIAAQSAWLIEDLDKANKQRKDHPWIIAVGHRPMYCSNSNDDDCTLENSEVKVHLENIFYIAGVDVIFEAHEHSYERLYPVYDGKVVSENYTDAAAPIHIITGAAGNKWGSDPMDRDAVNATHEEFHQNNTVNVTNQELLYNHTGNWTAFRQSGFSLDSYGRFTVYNCTHLFWEQVQDGKDLDSIWIVKGEHTKNNVSKELQKKIIKNVMDQLATTTPKATTPPIAVGTHVKANGSQHSVLSSPFLKGKSSQTLIISLSAVGGCILILITVCMVIRSNRNKSSPVSSWNDGGFVKRSFYRNIKNLENDIMSEELDMHDGSLPTSKLLSENMDI
ncbi:acid phosphatase type 7 isoform X3 [Octopus sinensis]|uniref:Purple acid phosphatase n=1 Tax=Octopus sinensis TaxID=2607531 RepID=A0A7E6FG07_9MOLL|nr:acid phosphatase type 7 isoform X3 [Octopus sinensis]